MISEPITRYEPVPDPTCPHCGGHCRIDYLRLGRWVCLDCDHRFFEPVDDDADNSQGDAA